MSFVDYLIFNVRDTEFKNLWEIVDPERFTGMRFDIVKLAQVLESVKHPIFKQYKKRK